MKSGRMEFVLEVREPAIFAEPPHEKGSPERRGPKSSSSGIGPYAHGIGRVSPADRLDCHQIHSAGLTVGHDAPVVGKTLADRWSNVLVPLDRTLIEAKIIAASFLRDFSQALDGVE